ncbi:hypothetical protein GS582_09740 [Rhodococcus hoagii]|nr:hypothetical protein [Prescottella equi]
MFPGLERVEAPIDERAAAYVPLMRGDPGVTVRTCWPGVARRRVVAVARPVREQGADVRVSA